MAAKKSSKKILAKKTSKKTTANVAKADKATTLKVDERIKVGDVFTVIRAGQQVKAEVRADGIHHDGQVFRTLSGAARHAAGKLKLSQSINGYLFFGVVRAPSNVDPLATIQKAVERIASVATSATDDNREAITQAVEKAATYLGKIGSGKSAAKIAKAG